MIEAWYAAFLESAGRGSEAPGGAERYFLKPGYRSRDEVAYFVDAADEEVVYQPDVYAVAALAASRIGATRLVDVGCGRARKLVEAARGLETIGIDVGPNLDACRREHPIRRWLACDLDRPHELPVAPDELERAVIVCSDVIEHLLHPEHLLASLRRAMTHAPLLVLSTPDRDLLGGIRDMGPPANRCHVREWTLAELSLLLEHHGLRPSLMGLTRSESGSDAMHTIMALVRGGDR